MPTCRLASDSPVGLSMDEDQIRAGGQRDDRQMLQPRAAHHLPVEQRRLTAGHVLQNVSAVDLDHAGMAARDAGERQDQVVVRGRTDADDTVDANVNPSA